MTPPIISQISATAETVMFAYGPMGVMLAWFMVRGEKLIKEVRASKDDVIKELQDYGHKIDGLRLALLANTISNVNSSESLRRFCDAEMSRIDSARNGTAK